MARATLTKTTAPGGYAAAATLLTETAANISDLNQFRASGSDLLIVHNTSTDTPYTFTITSAADPYGRSGTITAQAIAQGTIYVFGPMAPLGWVQSDGYVYCAASNAAVKFGVVAL